MSALILTYLSVYLCLKISTNMMNLVFVFFANLFQMYSAQTETKRDEQLACIILAAQVLSLGLWHARPHLRHQCGNNALASRYDIVRHG